MKWEPKHTSLVVIAIGFAVLYFLFHKNWLLIPIAVCLVGFLLAPLGDFIHLTWMQLAKVLGYINSRILLSVIFFVFLTPIALLMRLLGKTQFVKKPRIQQSLFVTRNHLYKSQDLQNPF